MRAPEHDISYTMGDGMADLIVALDRDARGTVPLVPAGQDGQIGCVALAAAAHAMRSGHTALDNRGGQFQSLKLWPWNLDAFKAPAFSFDRRQQLAAFRRDLVAAAALSIKAIDQIDAELADLEQTKTEKG
jgi:hypothetical protein